MGKHIIKSSHGSVKFPKIVNVMDQSPQMRQRTEVSPSKAQFFSPENRSIVPDNRYQRKLNFEGGESRQMTNEVKFNRLSAAKLFDVRASGLKFRVQHA